jgi:hypothetical protein
VREEVYDEVGEAVAVERCGLEKRLVLGVNVRRLWLSQHGVEARWIEQRWEE